MVEEEEKKKKKVGNTSIELADAMGKEQWETVWKVTQIKTIMLKVSPLLRASCNHNESSNFIPRR